MPGLMMPGASAPLCFCAPPAAPCPACSICVADRHRQATRAKSQSQICPFGRLFALSAPAAPCSRPSKRRGLRPPWPTATLRALRPRINRARPASRPAAQPGACARWPGSHGSFCKAKERDFRPGGGPRCRSWQLRRLRGRRARFLALGMARPGLVLAPRGGALPRSRPGADPAGAWPGPADDRRQ